MGLFKKKRKTTTQTDVLEETVNKIVKLTYIQSLAIFGGTSDVRDIVQETEATKEEFDTTNTKENTWEKLANKLSGLTPISRGIGNIAEKVFGAKTLGQKLFGKKRRTDVKVTIEESGWSLVKTWTQPQFDVIRYALGVKEITLSQFSYVPVSEVVSKPWTAPKEIQKISLIADQYIPKQFPPGIYIEYYVKPDLEDTEWMRINAIDLPTQYDATGKIVPRIITFNTERPINSRLEESYVNTTEPVKSVRFKAVLKRPSTNSAYTPILKSYRMNLTLRDGL